MLEYVDPHSPKIINLVDIWLQKEKQRRKL